MFRGQLKRQVNREGREEQEERQSRAKGFLEKYGVIRERYRMDFEAYLEMVGGGERGLKPMLRVIDVTKVLEEEKKKKEKVESREK